MPLLAMYRNILSKLSRSTSRRFFLRGFSVFRSIASFISGTISSIRSLHSASTQNIYQHTKNVYNHRFKVFDTRRLL